MHEVDKFHNLQTHANHQKSSVYATHGISARYYRVHPTNIRLKHGMSDILKKILSGFTSDWINDIKSVFTELPLTFNVFQLQLKIIPTEKKKF